MYYTSRYYHKKLFPPTDSGEESLQLHAFLYVFVRVFMCLREDWGNTVSVCLLVPVCVCERVRERERERDLLSGRSGYPDILLLSLFPLSHSHSHAEWARDRVPDRRCHSDRVRHMLLSQ